MTRNRRGSASERSLPCPPPPRKHFTSRRTQLPHCQLVNVRYLHRHGGSQVFRQKSNTPNFHRAQMLAHSRAAKANHGALEPVFMCAPAALSHVLDASQVGGQALKPCGGDIVRRGRQRIEAGLEVHRSPPNRHTDGCGLVATSSFCHCRQSDHRYPLRGVMGQMGMMGKHDRSES